MQANEDYVWKKNFKNKRKGWKKKKKNLGNIDDELAERGVQASLFFEPISNGFGDSS